MHKVSIKNDVEGDMPFLDLLKLSFIILAGLETVVIHAT